jgi:hypothetical protein
MSAWNHAICADCWDARNPDHLAGREVGGEIEHCCYCGRHTESGLYVRDDPATIEHHVPHWGESWWSRG